MLRYQYLIDGLRLIGWSIQEVEDFIEVFPRIWLQALSLSNLRNAVDHIWVFKAYQEYEGERK